MRFCLIKNTECICTEFINGLTLIHEYNNDSNEFYINEWYFKIYHILLKKELGEDTNEIEELGIRKLPNKNIAIEGLKKLTGNLDFKWHKEWLNNLIKRIELLGEYSH